MNTKKIVLSALVLVVGVQFGVILAEDEGAQPQDSISVRLQNIGSRLHKLESGIEPMNEQVSHANTMFDGLRVSLHCFAGSLATSL